MWRLRNAPPHRKPFHSMILHEILPTPTGFYQLTTNQFDNRVASPVGVGPTNAAGVFGAIDYASFSLSASTTDLLIPSPTQPNFIYAGPLGEITGGEHQFLPANSTVEYFDLKSLSYACTIQSGLTPSSCTIQLAALRAPQFGGETYIANLVFDSVLTSGGLVKSFNTTTFPATFTGLISVTVNIIDQSATTTADLALFDDVRNVAYLQQ